MRTKRTKRWKPTKEALTIIKQVAQRIAGKRVRIEIAMRVNLVTSERGMDIAHLTREYEEHDLWHCYNIIQLTSGHLIGEMSAAPLVELWLYSVSGFGPDAEANLEDQILVQFDEGGNVVTINGTSRVGPHLYAKGMKQ